MVVTTSTRSRDVVLLLGAGGIGAPCARRLGSGRQVIGVINSLAMFGGLASYGTAGIFIISMAADLHQLRPTPRWTDAGRGGQQLEVRAWRNRVRRAPR